MLAGVVEVWAPTWFTVTLIKRWVLVSRLKVSEVKGLIQDSTTPGTFRLSKGY